MKKIYINKNGGYFAPIRYTLKIIEKTINTHFDFVELEQDADLIWDHKNPNSQPIALWFYDALENDLSSLSHKNVFKDQQKIFTSDGREDLLTSIFYMINCIQEFASTENDLDGFGRFKYEASYQYRFESIESNLAGNYIDEFCKLFKIKIHPNSSSFFISHDIDTIYGSLLQDSFWAIRKLKPVAMLSIITSELIRKPHWKNIDKIISINSEHDIRSTFFWLINKGVGENNIGNADYSIEKEKNLLQLTEENGFINGLHKSTMSMKIDEEIGKVKGLNPYNRYHFLNFLPSKHWPEISESSLELDSSLGFAERIGFRNSYGSAFQPFDIEGKKPYNFVEAPLMLMDTTFHKYMKVKTNTIGETIIRFFEKNKYNCLFSLLWHNTYFSNYKYRGFLNEYKKVLGYIYENKIKCLTPQEIIENTRIKW